MKKPAKKYVNAQEVLPDDLLREVQKYCQGFIWVPVTERQRLKTVDDNIRNQEIVRLHEAGIRTKVLAERMGLCPERIRQILKEYSKKV